MWNLGAFALEFTGSVMMLLVALGSVSKDLSSVAAGVWSGSGVWLPLFIGTAVIASMVLFFKSFSNLNSEQCCCGENCGCRCGRGHKKITLVAAAAGVSLVALSVGNVPMLMFSLLGFAMVYVGTIISGMACTCGMPEAGSEPKQRIRRR